MSIEEALALASLIMLSEGLTLKAPELIKLLKAAGIPVDRNEALHGAHLFEQIGPELAGGQISFGTLPSLPPEDIAANAMRNVFERTAYTSLVPHFLAWQCDKDEFHTLLKLQQTGSASPIQPLLIRALELSISSGGWGMCSIYFDRMQEIFGPLTCLATPGHCVALTPSGSIVDPSYFTKPLTREKLSMGPISGYQALDSNTRCEIVCAGGDYFLRRSKKTEEGEWKSVHGFQQLERVEILDFKTSRWTSKNLNNDTHYVNVKTAYPTVACEIAIITTILFGEIAHNGSYFVYQLTDLIERKEFLGMCRSLVIRSVHEKAMDFADFLDDYVEGIVGRGRRV